MNLKTIIKKTRSKSWLATAILSLIGSIIMLLGPVQPVFALSGCEPAQNSYHCLIMNYKWGWHNVTSLTYCFPQRDHTTYNSDGSHTYGSALPADRMASVKAAANIWNDNPKIAVKLTATSCSAKTDIQVYAYHDGADGYGGIASCTNDGKDWCYAGSGLIHLNIDIPNSKDNAQYLLHTAVHEFGHVLGLAHPCNNTCKGPVMSYATCPDSSHCPATPNNDDIVGIQVVYGWTPGGGGTCDLLIPADSSTSISTQTYLTDPLLTTTPLPTIPDPGTLVPALPNSTVLTSPLPTLNSTLTVPSMDDLVYGTDYIRDPEEKGPVAPPITGDAVSGALDMVNRLADPSVDAYATLEATGGSLSNEIQWVYDQANLPENTPNPAACN
ncbi:MAG TPA: matrixin family metalloprotease [Candidatus Saccharimonadales bacterium]|nr:matrixin family metalloprotease [Candidatus Saccharimonadales bacterium]